MKIKSIFSLFAILALAGFIMFGSAGCDDDGDDPKPADTTDNGGEDQGKVGTIEAITFDGIAAEDIDVDIQGVTINILVPRGTDITSLVPVFTLSDEATFGNYTEGSALDFTQSQVIQVIGSDGNTKNYQITVTIDYRVDYGIGSVTKVWELAYGAQGWPDHAVSGLAVSGDYVILLHYGFGDTEIRYEYYDYNSGEYKGLMNIEGIGTGRKVTADDKGVILSSNVVAEPGNDFIIYKWNDVTAAPEEYIVWTHDITEHFGNEAKPWELPYVGLGDLVVEGDLSGDAVIYATVSMTSTILRWDVQGGQVVSQTPEKIVYTFANGRPNWDMTAGVAPLGPKAEDGFILNSSFEVALADANGQAQRVFSSAEVAGANSARVFDFNNARYVAMWQNGWDSGAKVNIYDITKPEYIDDPNREDDEINFWGFSSEWMLYSTTNTNGTGAVDARLSADGETCIVYFLGTNAGVQAYELSVMAIEDEGEGDDDGGDGK